MFIKEVTESSKSKVPRFFPWIGKWKGADGRCVIVLFFDKEKGVVLSTTNDTASPWKCLEISFNWNISQFEDFHGTVVIEQ